MATSSSNTNQTPGPPNPYGGEFDKPCHNCLLQGLDCHPRRVFCFNNPNEKLLAFPDLPTLKAAKRQRDRHIQFVFQEMGVELKIERVCPLTPGPDVVSVPIAVSTAPKSGPNDVNCYAGHFPSPCHNCRLQGLTCEDLPLICFNNASEPLRAYPDMNTIQITQQMREDGQPIDLPILPHEQDFKVGHPTEWFEALWPRSVPRVAPLASPCSACIRVQKVRCDGHAPCELSQYRSTPRAMAQQQPQTLTWVMPVQQNPTPQKQMSSWPTTVREPTMQQQSTQQEPVSRQQMHLPQLLPPSVPQQQSSPVQSGSSSNQGNPSTGVQPTLSEQSQSITNLLGQMGRDSINQRSARDPSNN